MTTRPCDFCHEDGVVVVVGVARQDCGPDPEPKDAIVSLALVCDTHNRDPWIEVRRLDGDR